MRFDIVHAADPRFTGGTATALKAEIKAAMPFGLTCALLPFVGVANGFVRAFERHTADIIDEAGLVWLTGEEAVECDILLAHHPFVFQRMPSVPVRMKPRKVVCVVQHPPFDGFWVPQYDYSVVERNLERMFGAPVHFAPVGPKVRTQFESLVGEKPTLTRRDFFNMIDMAEWRKRERPPPKRAAVIGRHSRTDPLKWPDTQEELQAAYPDSRHLSVEVLGGVPDEIKPWIGSNWSVLPYLDQGVSEFLNRLDFYVYFHSRRWVEAFGLSIAEAMASGLVTVLDPSYESLFEDGAVYAEATDVAETLDRLMASPDAYLRQSATARNVAERKFSFDIYPARMAELYEDLELPLPTGLRSPTKGACIAGKAPDNEMRPTPKARRIAPRKKRVLFVATNGIGLGHVTRLMAIAERMSQDVEPVFVTLSAGSAIIHARGHMVDYIPSAPKNGVTEESWNRAYAQELLAAIEAFDVAAVVLDSHHPYPGMASVLEVRRDLAWILVRRGMWAPHHKIDPNIHALFDMVIEPGEFADDEDRGVTKDVRNRVTVVPPILLNEPGVRMPRERAATGLGIDPAGPTVFVQLGSERNFDFSALRDALFAELNRRRVQVVEILNPLAAAPADAQPGTIRKAIYPISDYLSAADLLVTNAGYNSFHECIYGGVPTIFVPNEAPQMDDQHVRAAYAQGAGLALCLRACETGRVAHVLDVAMSDEFRAEARRRSARLEFVNGADMAAAAIEQLIFSVRTDRPLNAAIARI